MTDNRNALKDGSLSALSVGGVGLLCYALINYFVTTPETLKFLESLVPIFSPALSGIAVYCVRKFQHHQSIRLIEKWQQRSRVAMNDENCSDEARKDAQKQYDNATKMLTASAYVILKPEA